MVTGQAGTVPCTACGEPATDISRLCVECIERRRQHPVDPELSPAELVGDALLVRLALAGGVVCTDPECEACPGDGTERTMEPVRDSLERVRAAARNQDGA